MKTRILTLIMSLFVTMMAFAYDAKISGIYYNFDETNKTAEVTYHSSDYNSYSGDIVIPASVSYDGIAYNVTSIGDYAFSWCPSLTSITCLGSTPPSATDLRAQYETCILFVPKGSLNDYQNHAEWGKFLNIQELKGENPTDLETSKISSANIYTTNNTLHIEGATENYHILDAAGRLIYSGNASTLTLPRGIYLVTMGGEVEKIAL